MAKWLAKEFDWDTRRYTGRYYDIAEAGIVAKFVDSYYGDDSTGDGSSSNPYKTLGAAITDLNSTGANGSRIFMNGIFSETLPAQTYWYEFIGCGGGRNGRTIFYYNSTTSIGVSTTKPLHKFHNISLIGYINSSTYWTWNLYFINCFLKDLRINASGYNTGVFAYFTIFINLLTGAGTRTFYSGKGNIFYGIRDGSGSQGASSLLRNSFFKDWPLGTPSSYSDVVSDIEAQFINQTQNDFSVRITSPLIGAGTVDEITGIAANVGGVSVGLPYNGITPEFTTEGGATITDLTIDADGKFTITSPATTGTLETALMDLGNIYPLENIDLFNVFDFASGEITQGVFETFSSPRMALTIKLKYGLTEAEVNDCPWLLIEYGKQPTFSGTGASRVGNADDTFDPDTFQTITCRYMKLFVTLQNNS